MNYDPGGKKKNSRTLKQRRSVITTLRTSLSRKQGLLLVFGRKKRI